MIQKFIVGLTLTLITAISVSAQFSPSNARIGSIGDIYTIEDISDVFRYAAHMSKYTDDIQVTFSTPILGIKSMGDVISLGGYVRQGLVLDASNGNNFYARGRGHVNAVGTPPEDLTNPIYIPHALLGVNIGNFTLGFDMFLEWANVRFDSNKRYAKQHN